MSDLAIRVSNLSKQYTIGTARYRHDMVRDLLMDGLRGLLRRNGRPDRRERTIWALKDVSFDVKRGDIIGIIGRNGAGKSTLLKILSRITEPTAGRAEIYGRIGSLLEVGTGFDRELTGRENVYLNGAIIGMKKAEIDRKFDEIVAFAEVEKFIDTPVKRYSSGMYVRLAFAVAAHLEPEILIVDEVLAVGDAQFQRKCLGKMGDVAKQGRTVLFVSHNMTALLNLCTNALLLTGGEIQINGSVQQVVVGYLTSATSFTGEVSLEHPSSRPNTGLRFLGVRILDDNNRTTGLVELSRGCTIQIDYEVCLPTKGAQIAFELSNDMGICVLCSTDLDHQPQDREATRLPGRYRSSCHIEPQYLRGGRYSIHLASSIPGVRILDEAYNIITFDVVDNSSSEKRLAQGRKGVIAPPLRWKTLELREEAL